MGKRKRGLIFENTRKKKKVYKAGPQTFYHKGGWRCGGKKGDLCVKKLFFLFLLPTLFFFPVMSVDACKLHPSSIFLQKIRPREDKKKSSFSKLQSVGLSLVASVSKRKKETFNKNASTTSLPTSALKPAPPPVARLKPSISARPFSQFFFPIKEEEQQITKEKKINKRLSVSLDLIVDDSTSSYSTSRSSSLKTVKTQCVGYNDELLIVATTTTTTSDIISNNNQSDITFPTMISNNNKRLSGVARARTVLRLDSNKSREIRAIHVWKEAIAQLSTTDDEQDELYTILSHPALIVNNFYYLILLQVLNYLFCFFFSRSNH